MTADQLLETTLATTYMNADLNRRLRLLREFLEQKFFTPGDKKELDDFLAAEKVPQEEHDLIRGWGDEFFRSFTKENAYDLLEAMKVNIKNLPVLNLYVPIVPDAEGTKKIGSWVRENIDKKSLIELHVDITALGGCAFAWNGVYYDYTLKHYMHKKTDAIRKILDGYDVKK
jgi:hypothetical protein